MLTTTPTVLAREAWDGLARAHADRADALTAARRARRAAGTKDAVEDFLYDYYGVTPARLRRWHPGAGVGLETAGEAPPHATWRWYATTDGVVRLDVRAWLAERGDTVRYVHRLLAATAGRPVYTGCLGLHEWAMVYRQPDQERRHGLPLRLGASGTDAVVEQHPVRCSHIDAFRFFTPEAVPRNELRPTRETQVDLDQPGCLHVNMDCLKWALKLGPAVPGELLLDCFGLAAEIRVLDMRASPYDVSSLGHSAVPIETPEGKRTYVAAQRELAERAAVLRSRLVAVCADVLGP
ncbi:MULTISPECIES: 3-methyladenine DNA glycosylase [unclassified Actinotalea]|uniref:3-methyladenine DNA glycosylase n=1 Tax=unclassified Actinotalea TaxID=2638618 RepID=UPI0015F50682|nr:MULTISPECIES: 3-methyladenine DNA glycosylase [unclassified Actinotalea]